MSEAPTEDALSSTVVAQELERIAASVCFRKAARCLILLRHVTGLALEGRAGEIKEYALGVTVFERPPHYDPRIDPVVRLEARRLRLKLSEYYQHEGLANPVIIDLPKGAYVPRFRLRPGAQVPSAPVDLPKRGFPASLAAAGIVACLFIASGFISHQRPAAALVRPSVAVLGFRDLSPRSENSWVSIALTESMNIDLSSGHQLRIVPPDNVAHMRVELVFDQNHSFSTEDFEKIHRNLGSDYIVTGSYVRQPDQQIHLDVQLFEVRSGKQLAALVETDSQAHLPDLVERCAAAIRSRMGLASRDFQEDESNSNLPPAAMESYARGLEHLRQSDALGARTFLENAVAQAPSSPVAHSALAAAWLMLGQDAKAQKEASLAFDAAAELGRLDQLEIEGRYRTTAHDWPRAIQIYQALFTLLPDDLESGLLLASVQSRGGQAQNAEITVAALRRLPAPLGNDPRIDLADAQAAGAMSDFQRTREAAHAAAEKALKNGARLQFARARLLESGAMQNLGIAGFSDVRAEARRTCSELGDRACVAAALRIEANAMVATGDLSTARHLYEGVLETADEIGNSLERLNALNGLAYTSTLQGNLPEAEKQYRLALETGSAMGSSKSYPIQLDLSEVLLSEGRVAEAQGLIAQALEVARGAGEKQGIASGLAEWAHALALKGSFSEAQAKFDEAAAILRSVNDSYELYLTLLRMGDAFLQQGNLEAARAKDAEVQGIVNHFPGGFSDVELSLALARLNLAAGHFDQAESNARAALTGFTRSGREGDRVTSATILARALVGEGKIQQASEAITQSSTPALKDLPVRVALEYEIAKADVLAHFGKSAEAAGRMDAAAARMLRLGLPGLEQEARNAKQAFLVAARPSRTGLRP